MEELPLFDISIYGSWENFIEFWELMGKIPIRYKDNLYSSVNQIKDYIIYLIESKIPKNLFLDISEKLIYFGEELIVEVGDSYFVTIYWNDDYGEDIYDSHKYELLDIDTLKEIYSLLSNT